MEIIERGSEWRKWDLHFHTPSSHDYEDKSVTNEEIIETLSQKNISVVAITDHHIIDVERIKKLQELGSAKNITVLPGIEFLSDARGREPIHFIGIFPENSNLEHIWGQIGNKTNICDIKGKGKRPDEVYCHLKNTIEMVKELEGITTIHAGDKTNSIENITHSLSHGEAQKIDIAKEIDFYELGKVEDKDGYIKKVFPVIKKHIPMIICSDNHNIKKYELKENCWIKADNNFEGLKQVIYEPKERVRIQTNKPQEKAGYQVIDSIEISNHVDFLPQKIYLNQNLNSIIGGRSTGKSLLLGAIAKKLKCDKKIKFDNEDYAKFVGEVVKNISVTWKDGIKDNNRNIEYFPQSYMYLLSQNNNELNKLIEEIITQDISKNSLITNYNTFSSENNTDITNKINKLFQLQNDFTKQNNLLKEKGDEDGIKKEIEKLTNELLELKNKIEISESELEQYNELKTRLDLLVNKNENISDQLLKIETLKSKFFVTKEIDFELVSLTDFNKEKIKDAFERVKSKFQGEWDSEIDKIAELSTINIVDNQKEIANIEINPVYLKGLETFKTNIQYTEIEEKLKTQRNKLSDISQIKKEISDLEGQINIFKSIIKQSNRDFLNKINEITERLNVSKGKLEIKATPSFDKVSYRELLNWSINQQSYQGQEIVNVKIKSDEDYFNSAHNLLDKLLNNSITLKGGNTSLNLAQKLVASNFFKISYDIIYEDTFQQMSEGKKAFVVLMLLLDFSNKECPILIDQPEDDLDNRAIYKDLVMYLKKKKKDRQIILVTHNPNIVVGADAELVIVANQNGTDTPNENGRKFQYTFGSLENTKALDKKNPIILNSQGIKEHVCEILEGGNEAFKKRELKYDIK